VRRISEHSLQILRWLRHHLRARSTLEASLSDAPAYFFAYICGREGMAQSNTPLSPACGKNAFVLMRRH
jgi:hypothetical protein